MSTRITISGPVFLSADDVAKLLGTTKPALRHWRMTGYGPGWTKSGRRVLYPRHLVDQFITELANRATPTRA